METLKTTIPTIYNNEQVVDFSSLRKKYNAFAESQKSNHSLWYLLSLMIHIVFLIPMIGIMTYFYPGPGYIFLTLSLIYFFIILIENMSGTGMRTTLLCLAVSFVIHIAMAVSMLL